MVKLPSRKELAAKVDQLERDLAIFAAGGGTGAVLARSPATRAAAVSGVARLTPAALAADVGVDAMRTVGIQVTSESKTSLVDANNNSLLMHGSLYVTTDNVSGSNNIIMYEEVTAMNPLETTSGFIIPTDKIQCALDVSTAWAAEISVGFIFEVHTEKLSLKRIQELLVSLTAN